MHHARLSWPPIDEALFFDRLAIQVKDGALAGAVMELDAGGMACSRVTGLERIYRSLPHDVVNHAGRQAAVGKGALTPAHGAIRRGIERGSL